MEEKNPIRQIDSPQENIDIDKILMILRNNWLWIVIIFAVTNSLAYLYIRYTKNLYQSESEIKLDIKRETTGLGIENIVEDPYPDLVAGEIEIIQSRLFLSQVAKGPDFDVTFISEGRLLTEELFTSPAAFVTVLNTDHSLYNIPIEFRETDANTFLLTAGDAFEVTGVYDHPVTISDLKLLIRKNTNFTQGDEVGYYFIVNSKAALVDYFKNNLIVEPLNLSANTIRLAFKDHNPNKAQSVLNKIDTLYLKYSYDQKNLTNLQKIQWLTDELKNIERRMEDLETYFENFTLENKTNDINEGLRQTIEAINRVDSQRYHLTRHIHDVQILIDSVEAGSTQIPLTARAALPQPVNTNLDKLLQLVLEKERLTLSYSEATFTFKQKEKEISNLRDKVLTHAVEMKDNWSKRLKELTAQKERLERNFADFPDKNTEYTKNLRFYKLYEEFYLTLMQSKSEFEIAQAGTTPDFKILSPASLPSLPIAPNKPMIIGIGVVASVVLIFFFIGVLYLVNNKITKLVEVENFPAAPLLGAVPISKYHSETGLHILDNPKSMVSEAIRTLRTNLDFVNASLDRKVIAISSTISGEGKSFIAMNLGAIMALSNKKVLLVDVDMRKTKTLQPVSSVPATMGVSTILIRKHSWQDCVIPTTVNGFDFLPAGPNPPNPSELLLTKEFKELVSDLKSAYDFIILDTPPVGLLTDGIMAMRLADVSVYVFRANYSKKEFLSNLKRLIHVNKFSNLTIVLNGVASRYNGYGYGYGYYEEVKPQSKLRSLLKT